jgi:GTP-binding protein
MKPVLAIVGRPNVGKSTLFNRLTKSRDAIVADFSGLTRDRHYGDASIEGREFIAVDTGGFEPDSASGIMHEMAKQTRQAVAFGDFEGQVHFLDRNDGKTLARLSTDGSPVVGAPALSDGTLLVVTRKGGLFAFRAE